MSLTHQQLERIQPGQLAAWLRGSGFAVSTQMRAQSRSMRVYHRPAAADRKEAWVVIPLKSSTPDYARRVGEALDDMSRATNTPLEAMANDVTLADHDVLRLRAVGPGVGNGHIPVGSAKALLDSTQRVLLAAACSTVQPKAAFTGRRPADALAFVDRIKVGSTERGSFVIEARADVGYGLNGSAQHHDEDRSFERRVMEKLAQALQVVERGTRRAALDLDYDELLHSPERGVSANLCGALAELVDGDVISRVEASIRWACTHESDGREPVRISIGRDQASALRTVARQLEATAPREDYQLFGAVRRLHSDDAARGGIVDVLATVDERPRAVRVPMEGDDYRIALQAHGADDVLACEGELVKDGQRLRLEHARDVRVVSLDNDDLDN